MKDSIGETLTTGDYLDAHKDFPIAYLTVTNWAYDFHYELKKLFPTVDHFAQVPETEEAYEQIFKLLDKRYEQFKSGEQFNANESRLTLLQSRS